MRYMNQVKSLALAFALGASALLAVTTDVIPPKQVVNETLNYAHAKNLKGINEYNQGQYASALDEFSTALEAYARVDHQSGVIAVMQNQGLVYFARHQDEQARSLFETALKRAQRLGLNKAMADSYQKLGLVALDRKEMEAAKKHFAEALGIYQKIKDQEDEAAVLNAMGLVLLQQDGAGALSEAVSKFKDAASINRKKQNWKGLSANEANLAEAFLRQKAYGDALERCELALIIEKQVENSKGIGATLGKMALILEGLSRGEDALLARERAYAVHLALGLKSRQAVDLAELVRLGDSLGQKSRVAEWQRTLDKLKADMQKVQDRERRETEKAEQKEKTGEAAGPSPTPGT